MLLLHILFRILQLGVDGGGDDPALIGEGQGHNAGEQTGGGSHGGIDDVGEVIGDLAIGETGNGTNNSHQQQGNKLDNGGGNLKFI